jgi:hypothetical protein
MQSHMFVKYNVRFIKLSIRGSEDKLFVKNNILKRVAILHESIHKMHGEVPNESLTLELDDEKNHSVRF